MDSDLYEFLSPNYYNTCYCPNEEQHSYDILVAFLYPTVLLLGTGLFSLFYTNKIETENKNLRGIIKKIFTSNRIMKCEVDKKNDENDENDEIEKN